MSVQKRFSNPSKPGLFSHPTVEDLEITKNAKEIFKTPLKFLQIGMHTRLSIRDWGRIYHRHDTNSVYKVLNVNAYANEDTLRRFCWEAFYGQNVHHEHIISTLNAYHIAEEGKAPLPVIELEYIDGVSLERFIYLHEIQGRYLSPEQVLGFAIQIADAIEHLHNAMGLAHRDIKPKNIMLIETDGELHLKVFDLGLTCHLGFLPMTISGTFNYLPVRNLVIQKISHHYDIFAFGVTLIELIGGRVNSMVELPARLRAVKKSWPQSLHELLVRMLDDQLMSNPTAKQVHNKLRKIRKEMGFEV